MVVLTFVTWLMRTYFADVRGPVSLVGPISYPQCLSPAESRGVTPNPRSHLTHTLSMIGVKGVLHWSLCNFWHTLGVIGVEGCYSNPRSLLIRTDQLTSAVGLYNFSLIFLIYQNSSEFVWWVCLIPVCRYGLIAWTGQSCLCDSHY